MTAFGDPVYCARIIPQDEAATLESVETILDLDTWAKLCYCKQEELRALSHNNYLFVGAAQGRKPYNVRVCTDHFITLRGVSLIFPLDPEREDWRGRLVDLVSTDSIDKPIDEEGLAMLEASMAQGEGSNELLPWKDRSFTAILPSLNAANRREGLQDLGEIISAIIGRTRPPTSASMAKQISDIVMEHNNAVTPEFNSVFCQAHGVILSDPTTTPQFGSLVASLFSFYIREVDARRQAGVLSTKEAALLINEGNEILLATKHIKARIPCHIITPEDYQ